MAHAGMLSQKLHGGLEGPADAVRRSGTLVTQVGIDAAKVVLGLW